MDMKLLIMVFLVIFTVTSHAAAGKGKGGHSAGIGSRATQQVAPDPVKDPAAARSYRYSGRRP